MIGIQKEGVWRRFFLSFAEKKAVVFKGLPSTPLRNRPFESRWRLLLRLDLALPRPAGERAREEGSATEHAATNKKSGFTLIEIALVLALMGILYTLAIPRINSSVMVQKRAELGSQQIAASLRLARGLAISTQQPHLFYLNTGSGQFGIYEGSISPENIVETTYTLETGVTPSGQSTFTFHANGGASTSGGSTLSCSAGGASWTVDVLLATGLVLLRKDG